MTVVARKFRSVPERTSAETWNAILKLLAAGPDSAAAQEMASVTGVASSLITREAMTAPIIMRGSGPRVRIYCLYNEDAVEGDDANENPLTFDATSGDWQMSLPCPADDLAWVERALAAKSSRITARDMKTSVLDEEENKQCQSDDKPESSDGVDLEAFFKL